MKTRHIVLGVLAAVLATVIARATVITNTSYVFDNSTGNILTQKTWTASPPLYAITNNFFFDQVLGNYCAMVLSNQTDNYSVCSNLIWTPAGSSLIQTQRNCANLSSNISVYGRYFTNNCCYPVTNKAAAVRSLP